MLTMLRTELESLNAFSEEVPDVVARIAEAIPFNTIPLRMKYTIAVSEIMLYASQFRRNINHWDGGEVPINSVGFIITGSGQNKDSSVNAARKCFNVGYEMINDTRKKLAKATAIKLATEAGVDDPTQYENYKDFYRKPNPLFVAPSTNEGFIQHLNDLDNDGLGSGFLYSGEFGAELANSPVFVENLKLIAELYDLGNKEVKVLKARENQSREIKGLPVSALFVGSPANILYDELVKRRFRVEFSTKLARRSWFCYVPELIPEDTHASIDDLINAELGNDANSIAIRLQVSDAIKLITEHNLKQLGSLINITPEARRLFIIYKRYNTELAETLPKLFPISVLVRKHLQWKALKLAGAIALFYQHDSIEESDYLEAIRFCEMLDKDMAMFESELVKEPYELFSDYMRSIAEDGKSSATLHTLRKLGYLPAQGNPTQRMRELVHLAASYDEYGIYTSNELGITYEQIKPTSTIAFSFKEIDVAPIHAAIKTGSRTALQRAKEHIAATAASGYSIAESDFASLADILSGTYAYTPFILRDGKRDKDTLIAATKWLVFDIDKSDITADEAHFLLSDINHHIARTADESNDRKFRVFVELDSVVELNAMTWKHFYLSIANELSLNVDPLPQTQVFYSYGASEVLSVTDGTTIKVRNHIMQANDTIINKPADKPLTKAQITSQLNDPYVTFNYAYECPPGAGIGSRNLIRAARHAKDLGMEISDIIKLVEDINDYWVSSMDEDRLEKTILSQIRRWS